MRNESENRGKQVHSFESMTKVKATVARNEVESLKKKTYYLIVTNPTAHRQYHLDCYLHHCVTRMSGRVMMTRPNRIND